jgi:5-methylcytosine-specific restriction endonuclease McrA
MTDLGFWLPHAAYERASSCLGTFLVEDDDGMRPAVAVCDGCAMVLEVAQKTARAARMPSPPLKPAPLGTNTKKATTEQIVAAYMATGSVWEAGKRLGMAGQSVHERLVSVGHKLRSANWSEAELAEMQSLYEAGLTLGDIARRLGRPFGGCAAKASQMDLCFRTTRRKAEKLPRGAGYDKVSTIRHLKALEVYEGGVTQYARANGIAVERLAQACERHAPERWQAYVARRSDIPERECEYCNVRFIPANGRQRYHSRRCAATARADREYFGGRRRETIGLDVGVCQLCGESKDRGLSSHHVFGKENDPGNEVLIALCQGCHKIVTMLGGRKFVNDPVAWETLIWLAWYRRNGAAELDGTALRTYVEIDHGPEDEI